MAQHYTVFCQFWRFQPFTAKLDYLCEFFRNLASLRMVKVKFCF